MLIAFAPGIEALIVLGALLVLGIVLHRKEFIVTRKSNWKPVYWVVDTHPDVASRIPDVECESAYLATQEADRLEVLHAVNYDSSLYLGTRFKVQRSRRLVKR